MTVNELKKELERMRFVYSDRTTQIAMEINRMRDRIKKLECLYYAIQRATKINNRDR